MSTVATRPRGALALMFDPVFGALFSWLVLPGESPDTLSLIGMACIVAAIILFNRADGNGLAKAPLTQAP